MRPIRLVALTLVLLCDAAQRSSAQTSASLDIQLYAGLTITGQVGQVYSVEYIADLAQTNDPAAWRCLEFLQLPTSPYLWADKTVSASDKRFYRAVAMEAPSNMVFIPPGTFRMGSPTNEIGRYFDEGPQTHVIISCGFWLGRYEVTQGEYRAVIGTNPSHFSGDPSRPVEMVNWHEGTNYCAVMTQRERLAMRIQRNCEFRLPTEAEWEYACRAGTSTRFAHGEDPGFTNLTSYAWCEANSGGTTHPVGQMLPNPWGLHDMHGNAFELCQDWYGLRFGKILLDPQGPGPEIDMHHVVRGGSFFDGGYHCRSALRGSVDPDYRAYFIGFRVVLAPSRP